ncbi:hypothetical protein J2S74_002290 [Evansella vedderi]|uniref:Uncharacterized protein n=1 Tax=Evansella vedderi TaxID=38282 RepID=A0ABT9ZUJ3_9BACI|nr:hypothetical protein [Evansella vedderi]MDQ0254908.1 hypothetical protein [Evansella vedderi]
MLKIVSGSVEDVKAELKIILSNLKKRVSAIKKEYRGRQMPVSKQREIQELEQFQRIFKVSVMLPVEVEGIVINYKAYEDMLKKLKGQWVQLKVDSQKLTLTYESGKLELYDLRPLLTSIKQFPRAVIEK